MNNLPKSERLKKASLVRKVLASDNKLSYYPLKLKWTFSDQPEQAAYKAAFLISKRRIKLAVERNLIKRRIKEAYRINKNILPSYKKTVHIAFIYSANKPLTFKTINNALKKLLIELSKFLTSLKNEKD
jgi:ribonuclease P protein component